MGEVCGKVLGANRLENVISEYMERTNSGIRKLACQTPNKGFMFIAYVGRNCVRLG